MTGEMTMGQLASKLLRGSKQLNPALDKRLATLAQIGVGLVKSEIQRMHAVDTGTMLNSTTSERLGDAYLIGPTVNYSVFVALGTSRMAARPFHKTAAKRLEAQIPDVMALTDVELGL